jgi:hypothetical protein
VTPPSAEAAVPAISTLAATHASRDWHYYSCIPSPSAIMEVSGERASGRQAQAGQTLCALASAKRGCSAVFGQARAKSSDAIPLLSVQRPSPHILCRTKGKRPPSRRTVSRQPL